MVCTGSRLTLDSICVVRACALIFLVIGALPRANAKPDDPPEVRLGERLFMDDRFTSPQGDLKNRCRTCHLVDEDPQGIRAYVDFLPRSWVPWRSQDPRREGGRNSPTILDCAEMPRLHYDGEFPTLEALVKKTMSTRNLGWLPGEEGKAFDQAYTVILSDQGEGEGAEGTYLEQFKNVYKVDLKPLKRDEVIDWIARSMADYMRSLKTKRDSPYDGFVKANALDAGPAEGEKPGAFAGRLIEKVNTLEKEGKLALTAGFGADALAGFKLFFREGGKGPSGNCGSCHVPPLFTDHSFHNTGVTQSEYDLLHGDGAFAELSIPQAASASRPMKRFSDRPLKTDPQIADLGFWNTVDLKSSTLRRSGESDDAFLDRMIGAFKTPTLRNLSFTQPYMHNGAFPTLESALEDLVRTSQLAREGKVRSAAPEFAGMGITNGDIAPLVAFLKSLNEHYE